MIILGLINNLINFDLLGFALVGYFLTFPGGGGWGKSKLKTISAQVKLKLGLSLAININLLEHIKSLRTDITELKGKKRKLRATRHEPTDNFFYFFSHDFL